MVDPFCGEGMRHALDTGMLAAHIVAAGIRSGKTYDQMRTEYQSEWRGRWSQKRAIAAGLRAMLGWRRVFETGLRVGAKPVLRRLWE
jgi:flavin-dependent dehydrogenase